MVIVDLRSDTVTQPTPEMRMAMAQAEVGDDVMQEDPTVNRLEALAAEKMGKEAGLFVASGTMGNLIAVLTHCNRGDEIILGNLGHTFLFEAGGTAALGGVHSFLLPNQPDGTLDLGAVRDAVRPDDVHDPVSRLLVLENTQNRCGGVPLSAAYMRAAGDLAHEMRLKLHVDGARIFNAAAALDVTAVELAAPADSITFCLSKGLCAPVGSVLCGAAAFIRKARRIRKMVGGGMRQAGVLAAAGIIAIEKMSTRLGEDHRRAKALAVGLSAIPGLALDTSVPQSNMVFAHLDENAPVDAEGLVDALKPLGVKIGSTGARGVRLVTHYWIDDVAVEQTIEAFRTVLA